MLMEESLKRPRALLPMKTCLVSGREKVKEWWIDGNRERWGLREIRKGKTAVMQSRRTVKSNEKRLIVPVICMPELGF